MILTPFDFEIRYQLGKRNPADASPCQLDYSVDRDLGDGYLPTLKTKIARAKTYRILGVDEIYPDSSVNLECDFAPLSTAVVMTALVLCQVARRCVSQLDSGSFDGDINDFVLLVQRL